MYQDQLTDYEDYESDHRLGKRIDGTIVTVF